MRVARIGLTVTLFLIGSALSRKSLAAVGFRPLILGVMLWILDLGRRAVGRARSRVTNLASMADGRPAGDRPRSGFPKCSRF